MPKSYDDDDGGGDDNDGDDDEDDNDGDDEEDDDAAADDEDDGDDTVFYNHFATIFRTLMSFLMCHFCVNSRHKTVITCNTGGLMFKTLHCAFTSLNKSCTCTIIGSKNKFTVKYH